MGIDMDARDQRAFLRPGQLVDLVGGVGKNIARLQLIMAIAVAQMDLALQQAQNLGIQMVVHGIVRDHFKHLHPVRQIVGIHTALQQHNSTLLSCLLYPISCLRCKQNKYYFAK